MQKKNRFVFFIVVTSVATFYFFSLSPESNIVKSIKEKENQIKLINKPNSHLKINRPLEKNDIENITNKQIPILDKNDDRTELMKAASSKNFNKLNRLVRSGININVQDKEGMTALMYAIQSDDIDGFNLLINSNANIDLLDTRNTNALIMASSGGNLKMLKSLLEIGADPNVQYNQRDFTLLMDASFDGDVERVNLLIDNGANVNAVDTEGLSSISYAVREGHTSSVIRILKENPDLTIKDKKGYSPLEYAKKYDYQDIIRVLE